MGPLKAARTAASLGLISLTACVIPQPATEESPPPPAPAEEPRYGTVTGWGEQVQANQERWYAEVKRQREHRWYGAVYWAKVVRWHEGYQRGVAAKIRAEKAEARFRAARAQVDALRAETAPSRTTEASLDAIGSAGDVYAMPAVLAEIARCESGGRYDAENPTSSASGKFQFLDSTWNNYGGYARASHAPPAVQNQAAIELYNRAGSRPWLASRSCWGGGG